MSIYINFCSRLSLEVDHFMTPGVDEKSPLVNEIMDWFIWRDIVQQIFMFS